ncbi:hypothetical protein J7J84_01475 [bacterium]|nr:hypothetical protein [bacterium]
MGDRSIAAEELRSGRNLILEPRCTITDIRGKADRVVSRVTGNWWSVSPNSFQG